MRNLEDFLDHIDGRAPMFTLNQTFSEVCAYIDGFDACSETRTMIEFREWLTKRRQGLPELTHWGLVLAEYREGFSVAEARSFSARQNEESIQKIFELLRLFFVHRRDLTK